MPLFPQASEGSQPWSFRVIKSQGEYHPGTANAQHRTVSTVVVKTAERIMGTQPLGIKDIYTTC